MLKSRNLWISLRNVFKSMSRYNLEDKNSEKILFEDTDSVTISCCSGRMVRCLSKNKPKKCVAPSKWINIE